MHSNGSLFSPWSNGSSVELPLCLWEVQYVPDGIFVMHYVGLAICEAVIVVNLFITWALWSRRKSHRSQSIWFVINLSVGGILGGLLQTIALSADSYCFSDDNVHNELLCIFRNLTTTFTYLINCHTHAIIALDRYLLIVHSLRYMTIMTKRRALTLIGVAWVLAILGALSLLLSNGKGWELQWRCMRGDLLQNWHLLLVQIPVNVMVLVIVTATHVRIRKEAQRSARLHKRCIPGYNAYSDAVWAKFSVKSARVLTLVVGLYVMSFTPSQVVVVLNLYDVLDRESRFVACMVTGIIISASMLINPFMYSWKNTHLREDLRISWIRLLSVCKKLLPCKKSQVDYDVRATM